MTNREKYFEFLQTLNNRQLAEYSPVNFFCDCKGCPAQEYCENEMEKDECYSCTDVIANWLNNEPKPIKSVFNEHKTRIQDLLLVLDNCETQLEISGTVNAIMTELNLLANDVCIKCSKKLER